MPLFDYKGLDHSGRFLRGTVESESLRTAKSELKKRGVFLHDIQITLPNRKKKSSFIFKKINTKEITVFTRLLASLLRSGVPLVEALDAISKQSANPFFASCVANLKDQVNEGKPFYAALKEYPLIFDNIYNSLCEAGEASGTLDQVLERIASLMEKRSNIRNKILMALFYPGVLLVISFSVMIILYVYIVPKLLELFENVETLPLMTRINLSISQFFVNYWVVLICSGLGLGYFFLQWKKTKKGKQTWDRFLLSLPVFGRLVRAADIAMFSKTLCTLLKGGVPILKSMNIVKNVVSNNLIQNAIEKAKDNIKEGEPIVDPLERSGQFPPVVLQMIRVGEKTGELENMLEQVSESYDRQIEVEMSAFTTLLGPVMIVFIAFIVVFILISVLLPMLDSFDAFDVA